MALNIVASHLLPLSSIKLGRFVTSISHPDHAAYHDPASGPPEHTITVRESYHGSQHDGRETTFRTGLLSLLSTGLSRRAQTHTQITADKVETYTLQDSEKWFDKVTTLHATREWLERGIDRGADIYMVVGYHAFTNAHITSNQSEGSNVRGHLELSFGTPVAAGLDSVLRVTPNPSVGMGTERSTGVRSAFHVPGDYVCAFQYRKIRHRFLSSSSLDNVRLSSAPRWSSVERGRGEEDGEDDIVEVEAIQVEGLGAPWEQHTAGNEQICIQLDDWTQTRKSDDLWPRG